MMAAIIRALSTKHWS